MKDEPRPIDKSWLLPELENWLDCELGHELLAAERELLDDCLPCLFGYHLLQLSVSQRHQLYSSSPIRHRFALNPLADTSPGNACALPEALPLDSDCIDVTLLHHVLEYSDRPHQLLREAHRVLMPRGHLLITGFNPLSMLGLRARLARRFGSAPWQTALLRPGRVVDWLRLLDFAVDSVRFAFFRLPVNRKPVLRPLSGIERFGRRLSLPLGCVYQIHAVKQITPLIAVKPHWQRRRAALDVVPLARPSTRNTTLH